MRRFLFSPELNPGWEWYATIAALMYMALMVTIGCLSAKYGDFFSNPRLSGGFAIASLFVLWFAVLKGYRIRTAIHIAAGGIVCFIAYSIGGILQLVVFGGPGFFIVLKNYSEGPMR